MTTIRRHSFCFSCRCKIVSLSFTHFCVSQSPWIKSTRLSDYKSTSCKPRGFYSLWFSCLFLWLCKCITGKGCLGFHLAKWTLFLLDSAIVLFFSYIPSLTHSGFFPHLNLKKITMSQMWDIISVSKLGGDNCWTVTQEKHFFFPKIKYALVLDVLWLCFFGPIVSNQKPGSPYT